MAVRACRATTPRWRCWPGRSAFPMGWPGPRTAWITTCRPIWWTISCRGSVLAPARWCSGLAYKPGTSVVEASAGLRLARAMARSGVTVFGFDRPAGPAARRVLADDSPAPAFEIVDDPADLPASPDLVVLDDA